MTGPLADAYDAGHAAGLVAGYEAGYRDGFTAGTEIGAEQVLLHVADRLPDELPRWPYAGEYERMQQLRRTPDTTRCDNPRCGGRCSRCIRVDWVERHGGDWPDVDRYRIAPIKEAS